MEKTVFEQMGGTYKQQGDYLIPCLALPDEQEQSLGLFGQRHLRYLKEHHKVIYYNLLTSGKLNSYLANICRANSRNTADCQPHRYPRCKA